MGKDFLLFLPVTFRGGLFEGRKSESWKTGVAALGLFVLRRNLLCSQPEGRAEGEESGLENRDKAFFFL